MRELPEYVRPAGPGLWRIEVWVQPGAKRDEVAGVHQGRLKLRLGAPAVDNKANKALVKYLASLLGVRPNKLNITSGATSRQKTVSIASEDEPDWTGVCAGDAM